MNRLEKFEVYLHGQRLKASTTKEMIRNVEQFLKWLHNEKISDKDCSHSDILAFLQGLQRLNRKTSYLNNMVKDIRWYYKFLIAEKLITVNPAMELHIKGTIRNPVLHYLKEEELERIYVQFMNDNMIIENYVNLKRIVLLGLLIYQGLQVNELKKLLKTDVNLSEGTITVPETSTSNERILTLNAKQIIPLMKFLSMVKGEFLFRESMNNNLLYLFRMYRKVYKTSLSLQKLRSSRIILWIKQHHIRKVQYYTGMKYVSSLKKYQEQLTDELSERINRFHPLEM